MFKNDNLFRKKITSVCVSVLFEIRFGGQVSVTLVASQRAPPFDGRPKSGVRLPPRPPCSLCCVSLRFTRSTDGKAQGTPATLGFNNHCAADYF